MTSAVFFSSVQNYFSSIKGDIFLFCVESIDCGYILEPPRQGDSNEYPQFMFWVKNKKNDIALHIPVLLYNSWVEGGIHYTDMLSQCIMETT